MKDHLENVTKGQPKLMQLPPMNDHFQLMIMLISNADRNFPFYLHILYYGRAVSPLMNDPLISYPTLFKTTLKITNSISYKNNPLSATTL